MTTANNDDFREEEINLLELIGVIVKRKKVLGVVVGGFFVVSVVVSLLLPFKYSATARILPPQQENPMGGALLSQLPGGLDALAGQFMGTKSQSDIWVGILESRTVKDAIIDRFDLRNLYGRKTIEKTREKLKKNVSIKKTDEDIVAITVTDKDPEKAAQLANAYVEELDKVNKTIVTTSGRRMKVFIEKRLSEARGELEKAELGMRAFQEKNKAIKLDEQSKVIIESIGTLKAEITAKEIELQTLLSYATPDNHRVQLLGTTITELKHKLGELEKGSKLKSGEGDIFIPTSEMPNISLQYLRLMRDFKVQQAVFELLSQQYEIARIKEAKDHPTVQVLDEAVVPEERSSPKRTIIVALSTISGFFISILTVFIMEYVENVRT